MVGYGPEEEGKMRGELGPCGTVAQIGPLYKIIKILPKNHISLVQNHHVALINRLICCNIDHIDGE